MERISGWYKRSTRIITLVTALILVVAANADTIRLARQMSQDPGLRSATAAEAMKTAE